MPIADRKWNIKWIIADIEKENDRHKKAKGEMDLKDMVKPQLPIPDYVSKKK